MLIVGGVERDRHIAPPAPPPAPTIARLVDGDAINPGFQTGVAAKAVDALKRPQKSFLRQIARFFRVRRQSEKQGVNVARMLAYQSFERGRFAAAQSFKELLVSRRPDFDFRCRSNGLDIRVPAEGHLLSVAHSALP